MFLYLRFRREISCCVWDIVVRVWLLEQHDVIDMIKLSWRTLLLGCGFSLRFERLAKKQFLVMEALLPLRWNLRLKKTLSIEQNKRHSGTLTTDLFKWNWLLVCSKEKEMADRRNHFKVKSMGCETWLRSRLKSKFEKHRFWRPVDMNIFTCLPFSRNRLTTRMLYFLKMKYKFSRFYVKLNKSRILDIFI
jgi:hypothetical protein